MGTNNIPCSRSLADIRARQESQLESLRPRLSNLDMKDVVPLLVARQVLRSNEMGQVYSIKGRVEQVDKLIEILKTKNHWMEPMIDVLIRNGQAVLAEELLISNQKSNTT